MAAPAGAILSTGSMVGLFFIQRYRFLTINQFAKIANFSYYHAAEVLRTLEHQGVVGHFGHVRLPGQGKTPKVYYLRRKGWDILRAESGLPEEMIGSYAEVHQDVAWSPQTTIGCGCWTC
jgi:hypothetical protein